MAVPTIANQSAAPEARSHSDASLTVEAAYCFPESELGHVPDYSPAPKALPPGAPLPRVGDTVYLSSSSAWTTIAVVHEWLSPFDLRIEVWLEHVGAARALRPQACSRIH